MSARNGLCTWPSCHHTVRGQCGINAMTYGFYPRQDVILPPAIDPKVTALVEALRDLCEVTDAAIDPRYSTAEEWEWRDEALAKARAALAAWEAQNPRPTE